MMKYKEIRAGIEVEQGAGWLHRMVRAFRFLLGLMVVSVIVLYFYPSDQAQAALRGKIDVLKAERDTLQAERDAQLRRLEWIRTDVQYLEIAARDRLGLQKDGEFVLRFQSKPAASQK